MKRLMTYIEAMAIAGVIFLIKLIIWRQHQIYRNTCYRYVQPQRKGPAGNPAMLVELLLQTAYKCYKHQRNDHCREYNVREEYEIIYVANNP